jgi:hypothetical protein
LPMHHHHTFPVTCAQDRVLPLRQHLRLSQCILK